MYSPCKWRKIP